MDVPHEDLGREAGGRQQSVPRCSCQRRHIVRVLVDGEHLLPRRRGVPQPDGGVI